ncbi:zinc finger protein, putative [Plasmodium vinckei vinckei]|uniref:Zinc finger protein, putative n=1 Tax=Plasmodium vinckei vinckei TaxID=54757 RepID=A0A449BYZ3_PLAVN|nr:zinc finger protein, putative [Plasmodium vinckei vinckei]VEV58663.1 zinc finger protein, putative [Plasmodium vinckei vinckei]
MLLRIETKTWTRDSHDLFDYEAQQVNKKTFLISSPIKLFRSKAQVSCVADNPQCLPNTAQDYLLSVRPEENKYVITPAEHPLNSQYNVKKLWIIVKNLPNKSYSLHENDIIKLGRFRLKVRQFIESVDTLNSLKLYDTPSKKCEAIVDSTNIQCRICLIEGSQENDPLICPCDCKGSIKYAHLLCLRKWINGRLNLNDQLFSGSIFIKDISCELCKTKYPKSIKQNEELIQLVKIPNLKTPLIVLDNIIGQTSKGVHLISFADKTHLKLGRGHESDIRIPDVSISRYHATIKYEEGSFKLEDHNSKFGTLVALRKAREISTKDTMSLQVGRSVVNFRIDQDVPYKSGLIDVIENKEVMDTSDISNNNDKNNSIPNTQINNNTSGENNPVINTTNNVDSSATNNMANIFGRNNYEQNQFCNLPNETNIMQNSYRVDNLTPLLNYQNEYRIFGIRNCYNLIEQMNNQQLSSQLNYPEITMLNNSGNIQTCNNNPLINEHINIPITGSINEQINHENLQNIHNSNNHIINNDQNSDESDQNNNDQQNDEENTPDEPDHININHNDEDDHTNSGANCGGNNSSYTNNNNNNNNYSNNNNNNNNNNNGSNGNCKGCQNYSNDNDGNDNNRNCNSVYHKRRNSSANYYGDNIYGKNNRDINVNKNAKNHIRNNMINYNFSSSSHNIKSLENEFNLGFCSRNHNINNENMCNTHLFSSNNNNNLHRLNAPFDPTLCNIFNHGNYICENNRDMNFLVNKKNERLYYNSNNTNQRLSRSYNSFDRINLSPNSEYINYDQINMQNYEFFNNSKASDLINFYIKSGMNNTGNYCNNNNIENNATTTCNHNYNNWLDKRIYNPVNKTNFENNFNGNFSLQSFYNTNKNNEELFKM